MSTFGANVRRYRNEKGMTQEELAVQLGYKDRSSINKIESNAAHIPQKTIQRLADVLGVPVSKLFFEEEPESSRMVPSHVAEFLPYLDNAEEWQLEAIRKILDMPAKKICRSEKGIG